MEVNGNEIKQKISNLYCCEKCDYSTSRKSNIINHLNSLKHSKEINGNNIKQKLSNYFTCNNCKKVYQTSAGLWKHQQKCKNNNETKHNNYIGENNQVEDINDINEDDITEKQLILMLVKQNASLVKENNDFKNMMMEVIKNGTNNTNNITNNNNINSNNKTFNLQVFLNETCKDAMNINEFIDSIQLQLSDLENVGRLGFVEGISNIIVKNLDKLDVTQRPVHCTDKKREVVYIKDDDKWEKEDDKKKKLRNVIKKVANKNERLLFKYKEKYPDCIEADSRRSDQYNKIIIEAMGGRGDNDMEKEDKIIRNITKKVVIDKTN